MARILAVTWEGGGNVPPLLGITTRLRERGHDVRVLGHAGQRDAVEASGAAFVPNRRARPWSATGRTSDLRRALDFLALFTETGPARDVAEELDGSRAPDLLLVDGMRLSALRAAVRSGLPSVALIHTFRRYVTHDWARGPVGLLATLRGMRPGPLWDAADRVLVATDRDLDPAAQDPLGNVRYTGPIQAGAIRAEPHPPVPDAPPTVLVSLSTIFYPTQVTVLQNILDALAPLDVRVVAATGPDVRPEDLRAGTNTALHRHLPHDEVMPTASLLIGHGGHATTMRALAHALPIVTIPLDRHLDHRMIGTAVQDSGAGLVLTTGATAVAIRDAAVALIGDGPHRSAAAALGARIRASDGAAVAADEIEALLRPGRGATGASTEPSADRT
jgi:UDP:flavonoid glycosyltransferase YjiC (YdhE family)